MLAILTAPGLWPSASFAVTEGSAPGGPFELTDHNGVTRTDAYFHGSYPLIYFGFTHCPDLCPTTLATMGGALDALAEHAPAKEARVVPVFITVDPARDTVAVLKSYVASFHPRLVGLTGTAEQLDQVARSYGAFYAAVPTGAGDYMMDHSGFILLMGPGGEYITHFEPGITPAEPAAELERRVEE
jgi:protein SCO1/2